MTKPSKEIETIDQLLADPWAVNIQDIWEQAAYNPDPDKRQEQIINEKHFVI
ncbi:MULTISPECIES: hypothetical protein [Lactiplantibacillus]|uniref:hypothetical protein n=1 Tax=Lactiplantibacillus TaxID=2767842 RepID=UPI0007C11FFA|nr:MULTISPECIES: hypothetical protein [Lactiplantibacillus]KZU38268.1 hypothetical protein Nizo2757_2898 [Lactiplantibacillus plantarum]KZU46463.1 hypothetical protein Nizo2766_1236 [Lactiplantibacillus plantarum]MCC3164296.1 hypothetical protein [Lactiplantibacillus pentosus]MCJ8189659.1 hypothetical protein [Lactiplantibacillus pentosus]